MADEDLRAAFLGAFQTALPTDACPSPETLFDGYHRLLEPEALEALLDHVAECAVCADAWRLASRTASPPPERT